MFVSPKDKVPGLKATALSLGILYTVSAIIQGFGLVAVSMVIPQHYCFRPLSVTYFNSQRKINLVRIYAFGSVLAALCVLGGSLTQVIVHYIQKVS